MSKKPYYTVLIRYPKSPGVESLWEIHFGDYDKTTATTEAVEFSDDSPEEVFIKVIKTTDQQKDIDTRVEELNQARMELLQ